MKNFFKQSTSIVLTVIISSLVVAGAVYASYGGSLTAPGGAPSPQFYTLESIYNRLTTNTTDTLGNHSLSTTTAPAGSFYTLTQLYNAIPTIDPTKILTGTSYLGIPGTIPVAVGNTAAASSSFQVISNQPKLFITVPQGYYSGVSSVTVSTTTLPSALLSTGQTACYNSAGTVMSCTGSGEDGESQKGIALSYTDQGNGIITDNNTGKMWQKCSVGQSGTTCSSTGSSPDYGASQINFYNATTTCKSLSLGGYNDWRVPNIQELLSIVDYNIFSSTLPAINGTYFPNTPTDISYWSSSVYASFPNYSWYVGFVDGSTFYVDRTNPSYVRCVRG